MDILDPIAKLIMESLTQDANVLYNIARCLAGLVLVHLLTLGLLVLAKLTEV